MQLEGGIQRSIWIGIADTTTLFRVNTGKGWVSGGGKPRRLDDGSILIPNGRPVALGFSSPDGKPIRGASDLAGYTSITITPEMIGKTFPVFTGIETKNSEGGVVSDDQQHFIDNVRQAGGCAGAASSVEQARSLIFDYRLSLLK